MVHDGTASGMARCKMQQHPSLNKKRLLCERTSESVATALKSAVLGGLPDCEAECDLVDEVCKVVDEVQAAVIHTAHEVTEEVTCRVDGPACGDDETHGAKRGHHILVCRSEGTSNTASLATEDLEEDEEPSAHATCKANPCTAGAQVSLTGVAEDKHHNSANQELPERSL